MAAGLVEAFLGPLPGRPSRGGCKVVTEWKRLEGVMLRVAVGAVTWQVAFGLFRVFRKVHYF